MLARGQCNAIFALVCPFQLSVFLREMKHSIVNYRISSFIMVFNLTTFDFAHFLCPSNSVFWWDLCKLKTLDYNGGLI